MYKNGSIKIEMSSPNLYVGNSAKNAKSIIEILNKSKASVVLFPELCLSGYTAGDLFFETNFLEENLSSLDFIINNNNFPGVFIIGMPFLFKEILFNVAIVIQGKKILGIVPKKTIPNYKEFNEKRWFHSGQYINNEIIDLLGQKVPIGDILFINKKFNIVFGVEICQDLWTITSPSDKMVLNGAHLIFNLSSSTEHIGKDQMRKLAVLNHSRKQIGGYFYTSSGITESSTDTLFSNHKIAAVLGEIIGEKNLTEQEDISLVVDVFIDYIKHQRRIDTSYADQTIGKEWPFVKSYFDLKENESYDFEKPLNPKPFLNDNPKELSKQLKLSNTIQTLSLKSQIFHIKKSKILLEIKNTLNDILMILVVVQYLNDNQKSFKDLEIIINELDYYHDSQSLSFDKQLLNNLGINNIKFINKENINNSESLLKNNLDKLILLSNNLSNIAYGKINYSCPSNSFVYNINAGIPNTLMTELILFHFKKKKIFIEENIKNFYLNKINKFLNRKVIIEDFILYHYLNNGLSKEKIIFLLEKTFFCSYNESFTLVSQYIKNFYQNQHKRNKISSGVKIVSCGLSYRTEFKVPNNILRQEIKK
ncbi:nitrilase-related carbon-nitrogen hydrolase [Columbia Basin potato purple top phytoplasma]|uniref:Glutamine-dependent NAD(+) synthetase n=1 Tax=Columbia Basin potato purple top phytoplasma TaxID=307134 RepID=A0ABT5L7Z7_9MOLU|nr:nitrilase-related carbon-nitrogen hydrolase [Columbia Basin potato purple top phytoplasma]MDC9031815.1 NAD+ synthetase [Columbia Basin potato purple top phytoplasma]